MNGDPRIKIDPLGRRIFFGDGSCDKVRDVCKAICCRMYDVTLSENEFLSGKYKARPVCQAGMEDCRNPGASCVNRLFQLYKKPDGSCVYLDGHDKCSIHPDRPQGCRDFSCSEGWSISWAYLTGICADAEWRDRAARAFALEKVKDDMVFAPNPAVRFKAGFRGNGAGEMSIVKEPEDKCRPYTGNMPLRSRDVDEKTLEAFLSLFDGKRDLSAVREGLKDRTGKDIPSEDVREIAWHLYREGLIIFRHCVSVFKPRQM